VTVRIATWNINSVTARLPKLLEWLSSAAPDVVCLQELKCSTEAFPYEAVEAAGYQAAAHGTGRWNGVAILSRIGVEDVVRDLPGQPGFLAEDAMLEVLEPRAIAATCGPVRAWSVYVPNGREVDHAHYAYKLKWLGALRDAAAEDAAGTRPFAVLGDYNVAPTGRDIYPTRSWDKDALIQPKSRTAFAALIKQGWTDAIRTLHPEQPMYTFWDYKRNRWPRDAGLRLDHLLLSPQLAPRLKKAGVDRDVRGEDGASDHAPAWIVLR
jgi:exodeoxyribonuclease-3